MRRALPLLALLGALVLAAPAAADVVDDNPAAASLTPGRLDVAARFADGTILHRALDTATGTWSAWTAVPGLVASSGPAMTADGGRLYLAARGPDNAIWLTNSADGTTWAPWASLGGTVISGVGIDNRSGTSELDVGGVGTNGGFYYRVQPSRSVAFKGFEAVSTAATTAPGMVSRTKSALDAFTRNADSSVTRMSFVSGTGWTTTNIGGAVRSAISPISRADGNMDIYARAANGTLVARGFNGTDFGGWVTFTQNAGTSAPSATTTGGKRVDMVVRDAGRLYQRFYDGTGADHGWHEFTDAGPIELPPPPPVPVDRGAPNGTGAADGATVRIAFRNSRRTRRTYGFHRRVVLTGSLATAAGPISGATVGVYATPAKPGGRERLLRSVITAADGSWTTTLEAGPSRRLVARYKAFANDTSAVASGTLVARARAAVTLKASRKRAHRGDLVRFRGRVLGGPIPHTGKVITLQAYDGGRWRTFAQLHTTRKGGFRAHYRFKVAPSRARVLRFRVRVPREAAYPYELGVSHARRLTLLPG